MALFNNQVTKFLKFRSWYRPVWYRSQHRAVFFFSNAFINGVSTRSRQTIRYSCQVLQASLAHITTAMAQVFILTFLPHITKQGLSRMGGKSMGWFYKNSCSITVTPVFFHYSSLPSPLSALSQSPHCSPYPWVIHTCSSTRPFPFIPPLSPQPLVPESLLLFPCF